MNTQEIMDSQSSGKQPLDRDPPQDGKLSPKASDAHPERQTGKTDREEQRARLPVPPISIPEEIQEHNYVRKTMEILSSPPYDDHTSIVVAFGIGITKKRFGKLKERDMFSEELIDWILQWWSGKVNRNDIRFKFRTPPYKR
jgi:hypothetical protein